MKIYENAIYVNERKIGVSFFQLEVKNIRDFENKAICFRKVFNDIVNYYLVENTPITETKTKMKVVDILTTEMKQELINMGYTLHQRN